jgi:hypothetical protein
MAVNIRRRLAGAGLVAALALAAWPAAWAQADTTPAPESAAETAEPAESPFSGFLYGAVTARQMRLASNPANSARVPSRVAEVAGILEFRKGGFWARARLSTTHREVPYLQPDESVNETKLDLTQLSWNLPLAGNWAFTMGKLNLGFDDGQSYHPLDFFEDGVRGSDFEDRAGRYRGFPMLMLSRSDADSSLRIVYSDDRNTGTTYVYGEANPNFNRGKRQWLVSWRGSFDQLTVTALAQRALPGHAGAGVSASYVANASWSFHAAGFVGRGNPLPIHRNVFLGRGTGLDASDVYINTSPMRAWRADDGKLYNRWLLGATWTSEAGNTLVSELWRDGRGMGSGERQVWADVVRFHDGIGNPVGRSVNLGYDLEALRVANGVHWFVRYTTAVEGYGSVQVSNLLASDRSGTAGLRWVAPLGPQWEGSVELWKRYGGRTTMNGAVPDPAGATIALRRFF